MHRGADPPSDRNSITPYSRAVACTSGSVTSNPAHACSLDLRSGLSVHGSGGANSQLATTSRGSSGSYQSTQYGGRMSQQPSMVLTMGDIRSSASAQITSLSQPTSSVSGRSASGGPATPPTARVVVQPAHSSHIHPQSTTLGIHATCGNWRARPKATATP
ncbi:hypothetical protein D915_008956 [Fasciola hepatica]|uniref:Uncharacterized protein n=1 Tax=Fasciola hepatica TaxID=6192 RepID=A0A4E0R9N8_FASHE|nr:hypothetical protein D915_008956 [Fasciola hepatica]